MIELDAIKTELLTFVTPLAEVRDSLDLVNKEERAKELEREMQEPDFWDVPEKANAKTRELKTLKDEIEVWYFSETCGEWLCGVEWVW